MEGKRNVYSLAKLMKIKYLYITYTPNLGFELTAFVREREQGRFKGSTEGAGGSTEGV